MTVNANALERLLFLEIGTHKQIIIIVFCNKHFLLEYS